MDRAAWFVNVPWVIAAGLGRERWGSRPPTATFADGKVSGSTGCNRFVARYSLDGDAVEIGPVASTKMACLPPADEVERAYLEALARVAGWDSDQGDLVLLDGEGAEVLRYRTLTSFQTRSGDLANSFRRRR